MSSILIDQVEFNHYALSIFIGLALCILLNAGVFQAAAEAVEENGGEAASPKRCGRRHCIKPGYVKKNHCENLCLMRGLIHAQRMRKTGWFEPWNPGKLFPWPAGVFRM